MVQLSPKITIAGSVLGLGVLGVVTALVMQPRAIPERTPLWNATADRAVTAGEARSAVLAATLPQASLATAFDGTTGDFSDLDPARLRILVATGDVIPARYTDATIRKQGDDFFYPFAKTADLIADADLTVTNLEAPIINGCPYHEEGFTFCGRPGFVDAMVEAGIDVVTLENNHIGNYGDDGITETIERLEDADIAWADRSTPTVQEVDGLRFGFIAFNGVGEAIDRDAMTEQIAALDADADVVVVAYHWGNEYSHVPVAGGVAPDDPVEIAHLAVDAGADLIIGNHPHWIQGVEQYNGAWISYAHGNYIFDQMWSYETRVGVIGRYTFYDDRLIDVEFTPVLSENYAQAVVLTGSAAQDVLDIMREASETIAQTSK